jgi:hypothetical protein
MFPEIGAAVKGVLNGGRVAGRVDCGDERDQEFCNGVGGAAVRDECGGAGGG